MIQEDINTDLTILDNNIKETEGIIKNMEETMLHMRTPKENVICYIELKEKNI